MGELEAGELRRKRLLGSEALYRVIADDGAHVVVEVVTAPGLEPGAQVRLLREQVAEMEPVDEP